MLAPIINSLIPLSLCISSGFLLNRHGFLSADTWRQLDKLNYYVLFPALLFLNLASANIEFAQFSGALMVVLVVLVLASGMGLVAHKAFNIPAKNIGVYIQSTIRFNTYVGLALVANLFDKLGLLIFSLIIALFIPLINVISVVSLTLHQRFSWRALLVNLSKNPLIIACVSALIFNASPLTLMVSIEQFLRQLASASLPLGLLCVGAGLRFNISASELNTIAINCLIRLFVMPAFAYGACTLFGVVGIERQIITLFFALPTAPTSYSLTQALGGNHLLMANIISMQTLCAMISLPVVLWCVFNLNLF